MPIPKHWYDAGIAVRADGLSELATAMDVPVEALARTMTRFNESASAGEDPDFGRGRSAYDRYYGDPTITPNPNLRPLVKGPFYAVRMVLSDLGTCGGLRADERARVLREDGSVIGGLYAIGNTAANGTFQIVATGSTTLTLKDLAGNNVAGNGTYTASTATATTFAPRTNQPQWAIRDTTHDRLTGVGSA